MNLKQAHYIRTIATEGGVTAAAKKLYISQPSLSQMLRQMEAEAGLPLFERSTFRPTYAGERYLHAANVILNASEILDNELREIRCENSGRLRLGISMQRAAHILPTVLPRFAQAYPDVILELREVGSAMLEQLVREGNVDLALASTEPHVPDLEYHLIQRETVGILAGRDSPLAEELPSGTSIDLEQIRSGPFVALRSGHSIRVIQDLLFQEQRLRPAIFLETDSMETARQVTLSSASYMLCSDSYVAAQDHFYPLKGYENHRHFYACLRQGQKPPRYMLDFLRLVQDCLGTNGSSEWIADFSVSLT